MPMRVLRILAVAIPLVLLGGIAAWQYGLPPFADRQGGGAAIGGPFTLVDQNGDARRSAEFDGKLKLIYFGYTYCPDVCPTALQVMSVALRRLAEKADAVQPLFITIDPARDTPEAIGEYVGHFDDRFVGLTGSEAQIAAAAKAYRVYYAKAGGEEGGANYLMDHSSIVYLMDRDGDYITHFTHNTDPEEMARTIREHV